MKRIKFLALGGLGESGKNMYCLEINNQIVIFDAGLKHPSADLLGVDAIVPDMSYIESRKNDIQAIFISHAHDKNIGALPMLLSIIDVPVYATRFSLAIIKDYLKEYNIDPDKKDLRNLQRRHAVSFGGFSVEFFSTTHSIPETNGIAVFTDDGVMVYATDYTFDQNVEENYRTDFQALADYNKKGVLALFNESSGAGSYGHSTTDYALIHSVRKTIKQAKHRVIVAMYSTELSNIQKVINEAINQDKKIAIIGRRAQRMVDIGESLGYIKIPKDKLVRLKFIDDNNKNEFDDVVFLVTGERHEPFFMLQRMVKGYDRLLQLKSDDTVMLMCPPYPGTEEIAAKTHDMLYRLDVDVAKIDKNALAKFHAGSEDIKLMYSILRPKYIVPINGEFKDQHQQEKIALDYGYDNDHVAVIENGDVLLFEDGVMKKRSDSISSGSIMIDGNLETDINNIILKEREMLSDDGFVMIAGNIDARKHLMLNQPEVISRGFMHMKGNKEIIKQIKVIYENIVFKHFNQKYIDWRSFKDDLRKAVSKYLFKETKRRPYIIPVIVDTQKDKVSS